MATTDKAPLYVRLGNMLTKSLLRAGFKVVGPNDFPTYLLIVRERSSNATG